MTKKLTSLLALILLATTLQAQVEPNAGNWKTWFISSGKDFRLPAPSSSNKNEIVEVLDIQKKLNSNAEYMSKL
ncbi:hypothetical protein LV89_04448 [Arcicella aurantiaca]|uniref:Uncharacterized protein n=1 Tax=Arcicella aurantiaca TaxID=591202 RepID=A0A316DGB8_9BACT|nr:hypothetical protein [Arcicella aurantiaca]PWK17347.1 hypothetical protein LV89_04448 [Arcicella aurantiaca]